MNKSVSLITLIILIFSQQTFSQIIEIWGTASRGGINNAGIIFKTDSLGNNLTTVSSFDEVAGTFPYYSKLCEATNGKLYGLTQSGGISGEGIIYEYDPSLSTYTKKIEFTRSKGSAPYGHLVLATNGRMYGVTTRGGSYGHGTIFEYNPITNIYTNLYDFDRFVTGGQPYGSLIVASNGKLYGLATLGGSSNTNAGSIFEYDLINGTFTKKMTFNRAITGGSPYGELVEANNGKLYGLTRLGGTNDDGVLFEYDISNNNYNVKVHFNNTISGEQPYGSLLSLQNGDLYGMTYAGGSLGNGVIFKYNTNTNLYSKLHEFGGVGGRLPYGSLAEVGGKLYGLTSEGGTNNDGVLFEFDTITSTLSTKINFEELTLGKEPRGTLHYHSNGFFYGTTTTGGVSSQLGTLFEYDPINDSITKKVDFGSSLTGSIPSTLIQASNGLIYGTTARGGTIGEGTLFQIDPISNLRTKLIDFKKDSLGKTPRGKLVEINNNLYGLTQKGGSVNAGVIFKFNPSTSMMTKEYDFNFNTGYGTGHHLTQASNGKLYGLTRSGGTSEDGVLFEFDTNGIYNVKVNFDNIKGTHPYGGLVLANNGSLYGMTSSGGSANQGVIFEYNVSTSTYTKKHEFNNTSQGTGPLGSLIQANNGKLYGLTRYGGTFNLGVLFEYNLSSNSYTKLFDFDGTQFGAAPDNSLLQAPNGKLYGLTKYGGANNVGTMFEYEINTNTMVKKIDFDTLNGFNPYTNLIEVNLNSTVDIEEILFSEDIKIFPNPFKESFTLKLGNSTAVNIRILTMGGKEIYSKKHQLLSETSIDSIDKKGSYILQIETKKYSKNYLIIKN